MTTLCTPIRAALLTLACAAGLPTLAAQITDPKPAPAPGKPATPVIPPATPVVRPRPKPIEPRPVTIDSNLVVLDPAHGGQDPGGKLGAGELEKDVNLAFAYKLRSLLQAQGFTVLLTREGDPVAPPVQPSPDPAAGGQPGAPPPPPLPQITDEQHAELANRAHPVACLILHTTAAGHGVHLYTSALTPLTIVDTPRDIQLWDTAQAPLISQSLRFKNDLAQAFSGLRVPMVSGRASVGPIDSMTCPAVLLEIGPGAPNGGPSMPASDPGYQSRLAQAVASALVFWRGHAESARPTPAGPSATPIVPIPPKPKPKPKPRPVAPNDPDAAPAPATAPAASPTTPPVTRGAGR